MSFHEKTGTKSTPGTTDSDIAMGDHEILSAQNQKLARRVVRKFDFILLPTLAIMYLFKFVYIFPGLVQALTDFQLPRPQ
jgi:hypothetical protein